MRSSILLIATVTVGVAAFGPTGAAETGPAQRGPACSMLPEIMTHLRESYSEQPVAFGVQADGNLLQVFASKESGTWTVVSTHPSGLGCLVASGRSWESLPPVATGPQA